MTAEEEFGAELTRRGTTEDEIVRLLKDLIPRQDLRRGSLEDRARRVRDAGDRVLKRVLEESLREEAADSERPGSVDCSSAGCKKNHVSSRSVEPRS
jgi:hypothetical protein